MEISLHRTSVLYFSSFNCRILFPSKLIEPETILPGEGIRFINAKPRVVLPEPDSPAMPRDWPFNENDTPSTALTVPVDGKKCAFRLSTLSSTNLQFPHLRIKN